MSFYLFHEHYFRGCLYVLNPSFCNSFSMMKFILFFFQVDSLEKLNKLLDACKRIGVETNPMVIDEIGIIPLFSWYHEVITYIVTFF